MKTDKEKAAEILKKRKLAAEGYKEEPEGKENPLAEDPEEGETVDESARSIDFGLHR